MCRNGSTLTASSGPTSCSWKNWVLGTLISIILPFWRHKWAPLLALKKEVVMVVETIDVVTEVVEKVAEGVEEIAHSVAESLPDGEGLQKVACLVEAAAKKVAQEAHVADEFIHKVYIHINHKLIPSDSNLIWPRKALNIIKIEEI
ncbi:hypothetical protein Scep_018494 [Stephania cephalantha]|uniref:Uncharacterized protein n=1 Tax=Stephania cephalantha TaxID=152367 RepID=A0AAP0I971_9MAGN